MGLPILLLLHYFHVTPTLCSKPVFLMIFHLTHPKYVIQVPRIPSHVIPANNNALEAQVLIA